MSETNSGPALPAMSLRDYFAGQAIAGMCADKEWDITGERELYPYGVFAMAESAYRLADAMLAARPGEAA